MKFSLALSALLAGSTAAQTIVDIALGNPDFSTLTDLAIAADLGELLGSAENITVFAPVNDAFDALPEEIVANLVTEEWKLHLQNVLAYHVVDAFITSDDIISIGVPATALNNEQITFSFSEAGGVVINGIANVTLADIVADNGVIHVIDAVLLPSWVTNTIVDRLVGDPGFSILAGLATDAGLLETLSSPGPFTVFAPVDSAFDTAPAVDPSQLAAVLTYHVVPGIYTAGAITDGLVLTTVQGENITFTVPDSGVRQGSTILVNNETVVFGDILANNGVVHAIGGVLIPLNLTDSEIEGGAPSMSPVETSSASQAFPVAAVMAFFAGVMALAL